MINLTTLLVIGQRDSHKFFAQFDSFETPSTTFGANFFIISSSICLQFVTFLKNSNPSKIVGNSLKNQNGVRINFESVQKLCRKNSHLRHSFATQFSETPRYKGVQTIHRDTEVSSARAGNCSPLFVLGTVTKGFRGFTQQKIRENKTS